MDLSSFFVNYRPGDVGQPIWLRSFECDSADTSVSQCSDVSCPNTLIYDYYGTQDCFHSNDVTIECGKKLCVCIQTHVRVCSLCYICRMQYSYKKCGSTACALLNYCNFSLLIGRLRS